MLDTNNDAFSQWQRLVAELLPTITIESGNLDKVVDQSEEALINAGAPLYARGGELVKPITEDVAWLPRSQRPKSSD